jgi:hypothetical protein
MNESSIPGSNNFVSILIILSVTVTKDLSSTLRATVERRKKQRSKQGKRKEGYEVHSKDSYNTGKHRVY